jgi:ABC-type amino acid transport substrate-binding protein
MHDSISVARSELAPTGTLRVALNMSNFLLTATDPATGEPCGIAADLGRELGQRLGVPVALLPYPNPGELADAATAGAWDVELIGGEPQRAHAIDFSAAYVEIEATYLVPPGSPLQSIAEEELCTRVAETTGLRVNVPTTCRVIQRLGLPRKKSRSLRRSATRSGSSKHGWTTTR